MPKTSKIPEKKLNTKVRPAKEVKKTEVKETELKADVFNIKGEKVGKVSLNQSVFGVKIVPALLAQAVKVHLVNKRSGTRKTKTRGEVSGSTRKLFRQKGTGRARPGSVKSPIRVGGGIVHGPKVTNFHLDLSKKMKKAALFGALTQKYQSESIKIISDLDNFAPKTKNMVQFLRAVNIIDKNKKASGKTLLVTDKNNNDIMLAGRNLTDFFVTQVSQLNTYQVLQHKNLLFLKGSLDYFNAKKIQEEPKISKPKIVNKKIIKNSSKAGSASG